MIQRYYPNTNHLDLRKGMVVGEFGNYVLYTDHLAALAEKDKALAAAEERVRKATSCPVCDGMPHASGKACACGGTGKWYDCYIYLQTHRIDQDKEISALRERLRVVEEALLPFAHPDLSATRAGNVQGDESPVFGRDKALLTIKDFKMAKQAIEKGKQT